jgi:feruloyl esterase
MLEKLATSIIFEKPLASGVTHYPGYYLGGLDLGTKITDDLSKGVTIQGLGVAAPALPPKAGMPYAHILADQFVRFFVTRNPDGNLMDFDPEKPGPWLDRMVELGGLLDMPKTDLSAFRAHGGKILLIHGLSDQLLPAKATEEYYEAVVAAMGPENVSAFLKFYEIPGTAHSGFGIAFSPTWDVLGALDSWVVEGKAPVSPMVTDTYGIPGRTRPLCEYPSWPKYLGKGNVNDAASFACSR